MPSSPPPRRATALLFLLFQALYALTSSGNIFRVPDEFEVYFQTEHFVDTGDLSVPQLAAFRQPTIVDGRVVGSHSMFFGEMGRGGRPYAPYGPLAAVLAVPHHLAGRIIAAIAGVPRAPIPAGTAWLIVVGGVTMLATATAAAFAVAGFHRASLAMGTPPGAALMLSLMLGGASVLWTYGVSFFSEAWQAAALIWAAALLLEARGATTSVKRKAVRPARRVIEAAALLAIAGLTKVTCLVFAPAFVLAVLFEASVQPRARIKTAIVLAIGIALATTVHVGWNVYRFGRPFDFGYDWAQTIPQLPARAFLLADLPRGLAVLLLSPGKSIFLWAPPLLLALWQAPRCGQREPAVVTGVAAAALVGIVFYAAYLFPEGGYSHGPRNLVPIVPLTLLLAAGPAARSWPRPLVVFGTVVGFIITIMSTSVSYLEDQTLGIDLTSGARTVYYERVAPPAGRPWNRYDLGYMPFVRTLSSSGWMHAGTFGLGPDYFPLHLMQARRQLQNGSTIPLWLVWGWPGACLTMLVMAGVNLRRHSRKT
jgi:hypothetical protein